MVADEADAARFQQFEAVTNALSDLAGAQALVVVLDDLQWADLATLRLLAFAAGALRNRPVLLVGTVRSDELAPDELAGLLRLGTVVPLTGLDPDAVRDLLETTLGPGAAAGASATVAERSRGNPLFVREFAQLMAATGRTAVPEQAVPPAVAAVIERRLARQPARVVKVLEVAAVLGRRFTRADLVELARAGVGGAGDPALDVDTALAAGILEDDGDDLSFAQAFPGVHVDGFDLDDASVAVARKHAADAGVSDRVRFEVADAADTSAFEEDGYDLVLALEMVHDLARPVAALSTMSRLGKPDAVQLVMDERVAEEFEAPTENPIERLFYLASVLHCLPAGMAEQPSAGTGTVMRPATLRGYAVAAGFGDIEILPIEHDMFRFYRLATSPDQRV